VQSLGKMAQRLNNRRIHTHKTCILCSGNPPGRAASAPTARVDWVRLEPP
jgi:hypothetical protein